MLCIITIRLMEQFGDGVEMKDIVALIECPKMWDMFRSVANDCYLNLVSDDKLLNLCITVTQLCYRYISY